MGERDREGWGERGKGGGRGEGEKTRVSEGLGRGTLNLKHTQCISSYNVCFASTYMYKEYHCSIHDYWLPLSILLPY